MNLPHQHNDIPALLAALGAVGLSLSEIDMVIQIGVGLGALVLVWLKVWDKIKNKKKDKQ